MYISSAMHYLTVLFLTIYVFFPLDGQKKEDKESKERNSLCNER